MIVFVAPNFTSRHYDKSSSSRKRQTRLPFVAIDFRAEIAKIQCMQDRQNSRVMC